MAQLKEKEQEALLQSSASIQTSPHASVTDSVTQVNSMTTTQEPAMAMGSSLLSASQALANTSYSIPTEQQPQVSMQITPEARDSLASISSSIIGRTAIARSTEDTIEKE